MVGNELINDEELRALDTLNKSIIKGEFYITREALKSNVGVVLDLCNRILNNYNYLFLDREHKKLSGTQFEEILRLHAMIDTMAIFINENTVPERRYFDSPYFEDDTVVDVLGRIVSYFENINNFDSIDVELKQLGGYIKVKNSNDFILYTDGDFSIEISKGMAQSSKTENIMDCYFIEKYVSDTHESAKFSTMELKLINKKIEVLKYEKDKCETESIKD